MSCEKIKKIEELISEQIGDNEKIVGTKIAPLTAPGDNYGGILLKVDITLKNEENGALEELHTVVKLIPDNAFMRRLFDIQVTCKKEIAFYDTIIPTLQKFQKAQGIDRVIDFVPKLYGARINLNGSEIVDEDAAIVLENLKESGYKNVDRRVGFDLATTKLVLEDLAAFHAVPLALKLSNPEIFEKKIRPYLKDLPSPPPEYDESPHEPINVLREFLEDYEEYRFVIPILDEQAKRLRQGEAEIGKELFLTVVHGDMWVNNILIKFENGTPVGNKFVDFQGLMYGSPAVDLFFFLWSSVQQSVLLHHLDELINYYHHSLVTHLQQLKCSTPFTLDNLTQEIELVCKPQLERTMFMMPFVILGKGGGVAIEPDSSEPPDFGTKDDITAEAKNKVLFMVRECNKRGWL